ncbi:MAG: rRNA adenine dimethyltransferase family protein [bacterium]|nr:rRNA adenine dimethyltransferase family protein [bacterium]
MFKKLGQHFLHNQSAIKKIVAALDVQSGETIIEIGPGTGALTFPLAKECVTKKCSLIAIEKDSRLTKNLELGIRNNEHIKIILGDALKILPTIIHNSSFIIQNYKIVGNIPYYITGKLLRIISELSHKPVLTLLMIQKEVAERICAQPKGMNPVRGREGTQRASASNGMNLLAAATQIWAEPKILFTLKPTDFVPPPNVHSAVISLILNNRLVDRKIIDAYYRLIHALFKQPRKTLLNNLTGNDFLTKEKALTVLRETSLEAQARPHDLSIQKIIEIAEFLS